jgi:DNA mismatch repair ATPase MutS
MLDATTLRNLEITESIRAPSRGATLLSCVDLTKTAMGKRLLHRRLIRPLLKLVAYKPENSARPTNGLALFHLELAQQSRS